MEWFITYWRGLAKTERIPGSEATQRDGVLWVDVEEVVRDKTYRHTLLGYDRYYVDANETGIWFGGWHDPKWGKASQQSWFWPTGRDGGGVRRDDLPDVEPLEGVMTDEDSAWLLGLIGPRPLRRG